MTTAAAQYRCESCGAPVQWSPEAGALACEFCGGKQAVPVAQQDIVEYSIDQALNHTGARGLDRPVRRVRCNQCGAVMDLDPGLVAGRCGFCGTPGVVEVKAETELLRPESVLPFSISKDAAVQSYRSWLHGLWFRPNDLKRRAELKDIQGFYLPFWTYDAHADAWWTAEAGYYYYVTESYNDAQGRRQTRQVQKVRWERASGRLSQDFDDVLIYASRGLPRELCQAIEPFPTQELVPYDSRFLVGFGAEEYALDAKEGWQLAQTRMHEDLTRACSAQVPGDTQRNLQVRANFSEARFKHVLLPIWVAAYRYGEESYRFLVNGRTGEVQGTAPWSWVKITLAVLAALLLILVFYTLSGRS